MKTKPTITEFKTMFAKVFKFQPYNVWDALTSYVTGDKVLYMDTTSYKWAIYSAKIDNPTANPSDTTEWDKTTESISSFVMDTDITEAMTEAETMVPQDTDITDTDYRQVYLLLTAHFVITDWQATNQGLNASGASGILTSRSVGKMSAGYAISPMLQINPMWQVYLTTYWGVKAMSILARYQVGNLVGVSGEFTNY